jgi:DNA repair protein RecN (Recombination protein N)
MLTELRIRDYAVIERLSVRLAPGLNVLTGETGAGKSIIVGALSLLLGERASVDVVRATASRAEVEGVFDIASDPALHALLAEHGVEPEEGLLIVRREVSATGRSRAWINGVAATVSFLAEIGQHLVDLHGQHEHQSLLQPRQQRMLLDAWAGASDIAREVSEQYGRLHDARTRLSDHAARVRETEQRADFLRYQVEEIDRATLRPGEEEELEAEVRRLEHAGELATLAGSLHGELYAGERSLAARLADVRRTLEQLTRIDEALTPWRQVVEDALYSLEELGREMGSYAAAVEHDPARLDAIRRRQEVLFRLRRKYGPELGDVLRVADDARRELAALDSSVFDLAAIEREIEAATASLADAARRLSEARRRGADALAAEVAAILPELGMPAAQFVIALEPLDVIAARGAEDAEFRIAVNAGFEPRALSRVASGGELSRVMLALKTTLARLDGVPTLIFDEVDAGIGGRVARQVGEKLAQVARQHQVFVVTHLPQIASRADHHLLVRKAERDGMTTTSVDVLTAEARVREVARLLGGDPESGVSLDHARELLGGAA